MSSFPQRCIERPSWFSRAGPISVSNALKQIASKEPVSSPNLIRRWEVPSLFKKLICIFAKTNVGAFAPGPYGPAEFNNSTSFEHSVADESITHKEEVVDFLASYVEGEISIYYGLIEFEYDWSNYFNEINYSSSYYGYIYSIGREFDYLLKRKYDIDNVNEGLLIRSPENTQFFLRFSYDDLPKNLYRNFKNS